MKNGSTAKRTATADEVLRLARKVQWRGIKLSSGELVPAEVSRKIFEEAARAPKSKSRRKRAHAAAA